MRFLTFNLDNSVLFYKGGEFISNDPWQHKEMYHKGDYEIIICKSGPIYIQIEDEQFCLNKDDVLVIPPYSHFRGYRNSEPGIEFYWIHFFSTHQEKISTGEPDQIVLDLKIKKDKARQITLPLNFKLQNDSRILILVYQILAFNEEVPYIDERDFLTSALLVYLFKAFLNQHNPDDEDKINYIKEWIRANISATLTVSQIAENVHLNSDYLTRVFKQKTGMTTLQYLNSLKIEVASLLLVRTEMSIKQVAVESYFGDPKIFTRKFKSETGLCPSDYRKSYNRIHHNNPHVDPQIPIPKRIEDSIDFIPENGDIFKQTKGAQ